MIVMIKKRTVILDTNVLLHDPESPRRFGSDQVIIPIQVIEEVDRFKKDPGEKGRNARRVSRLLLGNLNSRFLVSKRAWIGYIEYTAGLAPVSQGEILSHTVWQ